MARTARIPESNTAAVTLSFNGPAVAAFDAKAPNGVKFRLDSKDGRLFLKPTDRKAGPHVFADFGRSGNGIKINLEGYQLDKLGMANLEAGQKFGIHADRYGWFYLVADGEEGAIQGAKASVTKR